MIKENKITKLFTAYYKVLIVHLIISATLLWIDSKFFVIYVVVTIGTKFIVPWIDGTTKYREALVESSEKEVNVNENIENYRAMLKTRKEKAKWWQFWI